MPELAKLLPLFNNGNMAVMLNVGTLVQPTTKAQYLARNVPLPPKLLSHNDQQSYWQASSPEGAATGWGGRIGDLLQSGNGTSTLTCINVTGNAVFLTGQAAVQYAVTTAGPIQLAARTSLQGSTAAATLLTALLSNGGGSHQFEGALGTIGKRALDLYAQVTSLAHRTRQARPRRPFPAPPADTSSSLAHAAAAGGEADLREQPAGREAADLLRLDRPFRHAQTASPRCIRC